MPIFNNVVTGLNKVGSNPMRGSVQLASGDNIALDQQGRTITISSDDPFTTLEVDLGNIPHYSGSFDINVSGATVGSPVIISQAVGPYTGKGTREDEAEMGLINASGFVLDSSTIRVYWSCGRYNIVRDKIKFNYKTGN